ncbi:MAG: GH116 family glycosyl-hydrolase [Acidobacteriota bacterium]
MTMRRRDVLKMLSAAPFVGLMGSRTAGRGLPPSLKAGARDHHVWRVFEDPFLSEIAFPLGGIGTGTVSVGGRGNLRDWEICNRPDKGRTLDNTFFGLWFKEGEEEPRAMILESQLKPPYRGAFGLNRAGLPGMPRFRKGRFLGSYPFARLELSDSDVPLAVTMECFNPLIPTNDKDSGLPVAVFYWHVTNTGQARVEATVIASLANIAGVDSFGQNLNRFVEGEVIQGIKMTTMKYPSHDPRYGTLALVTLHDTVTYTARWKGAEWFDAQSLFWADFSRDGRLDEAAESEPSPEGKTDTGSVGGVVTLQPGESRTVPFLIAWHFPNRQNYWLNNIFGYEADSSGPVVGNHYANHFADAWEVAEYTARNLTRLEQETRLYHDALFSSTVPEEVLDAVSSQTSILRTNTCFRARDGNFYAFEGTGDDTGCCPLNCTHVWNYEQALAYLFPGLERTMREVDFNHNTDEEGFMVFRTRIPLGVPRWDFPHAAADGQMGTIVKLYREWQISGDVDVLRRLWPNAKRALEFAWKQWDPDQDGVMEGVQHNTYDIEFHGPNPMMGAIYLTALRCAEEMALAMGDPASAGKYRRLHQQGRELLDRETWNGEFYVQAYDRAQEEKYQLGAGCLSDQLLGQWMAHIVGKGYVLPEEHVKEAIKAVYKNNFRDTLSDHYNPQRIYALGDEGGLLLCSWPRGNRPLLPFVYSDEVWTGIEYQVAAHLIYEGFVDEGVNIVRAVRNRYDGERRNPWNEVECGNHYARALASWSVLLALSGFQ